MKQCLKRKRILAVLALLGVLAKGNQALIEEYSHELSIGILAVVGLAVVYMIVKYAVKQKRKKTA